MAFFAFITLRNDFKKKAIKEENLWNHALPISMNMYVCCQKLEKMSEKNLEKIMKKKHQQTFYIFSVTKLKKKHFNFPFFI
jgi:hypothetical protein